MQARRAWPLLIVLLASLTGCAGTFSAVTPQGAVERSLEAPKVLVIRDIRVTDPTWEPYTPSFSMGVREWVEKNGAALQVVTEPSPELPTDSIVLSGALTEVEKSSAALRFLVGMGAGQSKAKGDFVLQRPDGTTLVTFTARRSYLGGVGMGGAGFIEMDELVKRLGATVGETTIKWLRGTKIE